MCPIVSLGRFFRIEFIDAGVEQIRAAVMADTRVDRNVESDDIRSVITDDQLLHDRL